MSDPECYQFYAHPRVSETEIVKEERGEGDGEGGGLRPGGVEILEAALTMRARGPVMGACCCLPAKVGACV